MPNDEAIIALIHALLKTSIKDELLEELQAPNQPFCVREAAAEYKIEKPAIASSSQSREELLGKKNP